MDKQRMIVFTGGSGKAGKHMLPWLTERGYQVINVDLKPLHGVEGVHNIVADITDSGQMHNVMATYGKFDELDEGEKSICAVVHFAAVPCDPVAAGQRAVPREHRRHLQRHRGCPRDGDTQGDHR